MCKSFAAAAFVITVCVNLGCSGRREAGHRRGIEGDGRRRPEFDHLRGSAAVGNFGQSRTISFGLASTRISNYVRTIDFTTPALARDRRHAAAGAGPRRSRCRR